MSGERGTRNLIAGGVLDTRYELRRLIARGGMGLVFEAHHRFTRRTVAVKILAPQVRDMVEAHGRLLREALALTAVRHAGFVEGLDAGVCARCGPYIVMEMLEGRSLDGILAARRQLPVADAVQLALQVCEAVAHAHSRGVIHRDLKPSNFVVTRNAAGREVVKVIDLGVAAVAEGRLEAGDAKLTVANEVLGTPEYMAPEQLWGREVDARADVYSLGMSLYECLTGEVPYSGSYPEVLVLVANATTSPSVRARRPEVPVALAAVVERAIRKDPSDRFPSAIALAHALLAALAAAPEPADLPVSSPDSEVLARRSEPAIDLVRKKPPEGSLGRRGPDHRAFLRVPYVTPVVLAPDGSAEIESRCHEISEGGMLVMSPVALGEGTRLELRFAAPVAGDIVRVKARVRWGSGGRGHHAMGLEFEALSIRLRGLVAQYVEINRAPLGSTQRGH